VSRGQRLVTQRLVTLGGAPAEEASKPEAAGAETDGVETGPPARGRRYWRSLERLRDSPAMAAEGRLPEELRPEFAAGADLPPDAVTRRTVLGLMGASMAMAGLAGCRRPEEAIVPYVRAPENVTPGLARHYASTFPLAADALGVVVETHDGRPTKIEGNPEHPASQGGANAWAQASILHLYDPDRVPRPQLRQRHTVAAGGDDPAVEVAAGEIADGQQAGGEVEPAGGGHGAGRDGGAAVTDARQGASATTWGDFTTFWQGRAEALGGDGSRLAVLTGDGASPTVERLAGELEGRFPGLTWVAYDANAADTAGSAPALHHLDRARVVLALDADLFLTEPGAVAAARGFARGRRVDENGDGEVNRLYVVEPTPTATGGSADHRLRLKASQVAAFARAVAAEMGVSASAGDAPQSDSPQPDSPPPETQQLETQPPEPLPQLALDAVPVIAADLRRAGSSALVAAGRRQPPEVHALARGLNRALGAEGTTVTYGPGPRGGGSAGGPAAAFADLVTAMRGGEIDTLVILGGNPVYSSPADLDLAGALPRVPHVVYLAHGWDETAAHADWLLPEAGWMESWGDARAADGTASLVQPLVAPLFDSRSAAEVVALLAAGEERPGYELVRETWMGQLGGDAAWRQALHRGVLPGAAPAGGTAAGSGGEAATETATTETPATETAAAATAAGETAVAETAVAEPENAAAAEAPAEGSSLAATSPAEDHAEAATASDSAGHAAPAVAAAGWAADPGAERGSPAGHQPKLDLELVFSLSPSVFDGRFANVAWLQEMPDPVTKVTWANPALVSPATARRLGLEDGDVAVLYHAGRRVRIPVVAQPGTADDTVVVELGYGRRGAGRVGDGVGVDVGRLRTSAAPWIAPAAGLAATGESFALARTQEHDAMEGRHLVREADLGQFRRDRRFTERFEVDVEKVTNLWEEPGYDGPHQWGMTIDLNACTGCNACVVACQSENNVPVVGPDQVRKGRELQWLRVDRYFEGDGDEARPVFQPVPCMHCENAPCEQVCPVAATVHDEEGLNAMVYNRCIGTRYCSNNCPYKVRRFNYFNFTKDTPELVKAAMNPDVTVRSRGVMEKCTYCVQRINEGKAAAKRARRRLADGEVKTACQQTCPAEAITFGDLSDADSAVSRTKRSPRNYVLLAELNNHPRTSYLARVRNPNPDWPGYHQVPLPPARPAAGPGEGSVGAGSRGDGAHGDGAHGGEGGH